MHLPSLGATIPFGLLIGSNCAKALEPCDVVPSQSGGPYAIRTPLGWCVIGRLGATSKVSVVKCNFVNTQPSAMHESRKGCVVSVPPALR